MKKKLLAMLSLAMLTAPVASTAMDTPDHILKRFDYNKKTSIQTFEEISLGEVRSGFKLASTIQDMVYLEEFSTQMMRDVDQFLWKRKYRIFSGQIDSLDPKGETYKNKFYYFKTKKAGKNPLIFIFPSIMGITTVEKRMAAYFARKGNNVIVARLQEDIADIERPIEDIDGFLIRSTTSARVLCDMAQQFTEVDPDRIASFGASLGGIRLMIAMGVDKRFKYGVTYVTGGDLPDIMTESLVPEIMMYRMKKMQDLELKTKQEYREALERVSTVDPLLFADYLDSDNIMMGIATKDVHVPSKNQYKLWRKLGQPLARFLKRGHVMSIIGAYTNKRKTLAFFREKWKNVDSNIDL